MTPIRSLALGAPLLLALAPATTPPRMGERERVRLAEAFAVIADVQDSPTFLATFPAFGPTPTIVVGTAEGTGKRSTRWMLAVAHEHFHQLQYAFGAGLGFLLDQDGRDWRPRYLAEKFYLERYRLTRAEAPS